jgi:Flp pilus assembly protein TadD
MRAKFARRSIIFLALIILTCLFSLHSALLSSGDAASSQDPNATLPTTTKSKPAKKSAPTPKKNTSPARTSRSNSEIAFWETIKNSTDAEDFREYLRKYPNGEFAGLAKNRLKTLEAGKSNAAGNPTNPDSSNPSTNVTSKPKPTVEAALPDPPPGVTAEQHAKNGFDLGIYKNKYPEAETEYRWAIKLSPNVAEYHSTLAKILQADKKSTEAEAEYKEAVRLEPSNADYHEDLGTFLSFHNERYGEAEAEYRAAVHLKPNSHLYHSNLAFALKNQKKYLEAEAEYREAARLDPDSPPESLANLLEDQHKVAEAERIYREFLQSHQNHGRGHYYFAELLHKEGKWEEAEKEYREAIRSEPSDGFYYSRLAMFLSERGRWSEAEHEHLEAIHLGKGKYSEGDSHYWYAKDLSSQGKLAESEVEYREAVRIRSKEAYFHSGFGDVLGKQNRWKEAEAEYREAIRLTPEGQASLQKYQEKLQQAIKAQKK